jgi:hypothetical protein
VTIVNLYGQGGLVIVSGYKPSGLPLLPKKTVFIFKLSLILYGDSSARFFVE